MAQNKNKKFRKPIGTAKKTGETEAWPWERTAGFCQSDSHPWHVCLSFAEQKPGTRDYTTVCLFHPIRGQDSRGINCIYLGEYGHT